jgi:hypothetical protein
MLLLEAADIKGPGEANYPSSISSSRAVSHPFILDLYGSLSEKVIWNTREIPMDAHFFSRRYYGFGRFRRCSDRGPVPTSTSVDLDMG